MRRSRPGFRALARLEGAPALLLGLPLAFLALFFFYPLAGIFAQSAFDRTVSLANYRRILTGGPYLRVYWNTLELGLGVTLLCLLAGYPFAYVMATAGDRVRNFLIAMVLLPFWVSSLVRTYGWMVLLGRQGVINQSLLGLGVIDRPLPLMFNMLGVLLGMVHILLPFMVFPLYSVMRGIDPALLRAAYSLGARPRAAFLRVYLPLTAPGIAAGSLLVFIVSVGFFVTPALLGGRGNVVISMLIEEQVNQILNWGFAAALAVTLLALTLAAVALVNRFVKIETVSGGAT